MESIQKNKNLSIEIIEDDIMLRQVMRDKLHVEGFTVLEAGDGAEGLMLALNRRPDLILLDISMPVMDGLTMMGKLRRENEWGKKVPVIFLTNLGPDDEERMTAITVYEPAYYLIKASSSMSDILAKIQERCSRAVA